MFFIIINQNQDKYYNNQKLYQKGMRKHNNITQDITLYIGIAKIIILNNTHQITFALRTLFVNQKMIYTYNNLSSAQESNLNAFSRSRNTPISIQKLTNYQYQYKITPALRQRLLLGQEDSGVLKYLQELKLPNIEKQDNNIVAIINQQDKSMNGFVFNNKKQAQQFYKSINIAIMTQNYINLLNQPLTFNYNLCNSLCNFMNGRLIIDPQDYDQKNEEIQIQLFIKIVSLSKSQQLINVQDGLFQQALRFKIVDEISISYAVKFLNILPERIQKLVLSDCYLNSNMFGQIFSSQKQKLSEKMLNLYELNLTKNNFNDDILTNITRILSLSTKLTKLNLSQNLIIFEKQSIISSFLQAITNNKMDLNLSKNQITNIKYIKKYLINAEGVIPISILNLSYNLINPENLNILTKLYINKYQNKNSNYNLKIILAQLEFQEPHAIQFFKLENYFKRTNFTSIPISLSKHPIKKHGKEVGVTKEETSKAELIDKLYKDYCFQLYRGHFNKLKQIKSELLSLNIQEQQFQSQIKQFQARRKQQESNIINKFESCLNFQLPPQKILSQINNALKYARRKGLIGPAMDTLSYIKSKIQQYLQEIYTKKQIINVYAQIILIKKKRFSSLYQRSKTEDSIINVNYNHLINKTPQQLMKQFISDEQMNNVGRFMAYQFLLLSEKPKKYHPYMIESCLTDPRLVSAKIVYFQKSNLIQFQEGYRINKSFFKSKQAKINIVALHGIETYKFSKSFNQSNISSSKYMGVLSPNKIQPEHQKIITAFIQICKNFLIFLYYTPNELSEQTVIYINYISNYLLDLQTQAQDDLKNILVEEFILHSITFYDKSIHQPLQKRLFLTIFQFLSRRITIEQPMIYMLLAYFIRTQQIEENQIQIHTTDCKQAWEGKIDWPIRDIKFLKSFIMNKCKLQIKIADITNPILSITLMVDEMTTVLDLWHLTKTNIKKCSQFMNINENTIDLYWICGLKLNTQKNNFKLLPSYQPLGRLIFEQSYESTFYLRRIINKPQYHTHNYLSKLNYGQLLQIYEQSKVSLRSSLFYMMPKGAQDKITAIVIQTIWIDILLIEEVVLNAQRRQNDEQSLMKMKLQIQKISNQCISKLYSHYLPVGVLLDDEDKMQIILQIKKRQTQNKRTKNISQIIIQKISLYFNLIGANAYTIKCSNSNEKYNLHINNYQFAFVDLTNNVAKIIRSKFRNILWFQLALEGQEPVLKFQIVEQIKSHEISLLKFSIQGDYLWLAQCFVLINQICKIRLSYPTQFLFLCQDSQNGFCNYSIKQKIDHNYNIPALDLTKYFKFQLSKKIAKQNKNKTFNQNIIIKTIQSKDNLKYKQRVDQQKDNFNKLVDQQKNNFNKLQLPIENVFIKSSKPITLNMQEIPQFPERSTISQKNIDFDDVIKNAEKQQNEEDLVVTARRSSNTKKDAPRRRSRNR